MFRTAMFEWHNLASLLARRSAGSRSESARRHRHLALRACSWRARCSRALISSKCLARAADDVGALYPLAAVAAESLAYCRLVMMAWPALPTTTAVRRKRCTNNHGGRHARQLLSSSHGVQPTAGSAAAVQGPCAMAHRAAAALAANSPGADTLAVHRKV